MYSRRGRGGGGYYRSKRGRGNSWVRGTDAGPSTGTTTTTTSTGPVLKGPKVVMSHTWKRPEKAVGTADTGSYVPSQTEQTEQSEPSPTSNIITPPAEVPKIVPSQPASVSDKPPPNMFKKGSNKLVRTVVGDSSEAPSRAMESKVPATAAQMKNVGGNKLVMKNYKKPVEQHRSFPSGNMKPAFKPHVYKEEAPVKDEVSLDFNSQAMKAKGRNKLVSESRLEEEMRLKESLKRKRLESKRGRAKGPAKRVKLDNTSSVDNDDGDGDQQQQHRDEKLTDFAYQQTSNNRRRTNMGLVRVAGAEDAPICPTFARGMPCTNPKCRKRHDVAREAPICSFFQRNGQCLKRDTCPFRHIKVNPHAMICSSYSLLGYCEDDYCQMKHVRR
jgi:hypothetical protein